MPPAPSGEEVANKVRQLPTEIAAGWASPGKQPTGSRDSDIEPRCHIDRSAAVRAEGMRFQTACPSDALTLYRTEEVR